MSDVSRLPVTALSVWEWQYSGACRDADAHLFFHPDDERGPARRRRDALAVRICATCPVIERCRQHALAVREPYGVWGGLTEPNRLALRRLETQVPDISQASSPPGWMDPETASASGE